MAMGGVDDCQPAHAESRGAVGVQAAIVRPAVLLVPHHVVHRRLAGREITLGGDDYGYATHKGNTPGTASPGRFQLTEAATTIFSPTEGKTVA